MVRQEGGRWDVGAKNNAVYLERRSEDDERLFETQLAPEEARELAALLTKSAVRLIRPTTTTRLTTTTRPTMMTRPTIPQTRTCLSPSSPAAQHSPADLRPSRAPWK